MKVYLFVALLSFNLFAWQDQLDSLEAAGELDEAVLFLDSLSYQEEDFIEKALILEELSDYFNLLDMTEEFQATENRLSLHKEKMKQLQRDLASQKESQNNPTNLSSQDQEIQTTEGKEELSNDSTIEEGKYVEFQIARSLQARSDVSTQRQTVDTTQFNQVVFGLDYFKSDGENYSIVDLQFRLERERFRENNFFSNVDSNLSQTTSLGLGISYTAGDDFWFHNLSIDWIPIVNSESTQEQGGVDNFYITEFMRLNNEVNNSLALPMSFYLSYAKQWSTSVGTDLSIDIEPSNFFSFSLGAYANATRLHLSNYEHTTVTIEGDSLNNRFTNLVNARDTLDLNNPITAQTYDGFVQVFQNAASNQTSLSEEFQLDPYYVGLNAQLEMYSQEWSLGVQLDLSQGRFFQKEKYYTVENDPNTYLALNALVESNNETYGVFNDGNIDYYDRVEARYQSPTFLTYQVKPYLSYQNTSYWGLELNLHYEQRDYSIAPVYLGYRPQQSAQEKDVGLSINGSYNF